MSILSRKITITVGAGTSLVVRVGWNAHSTMFDPSRGAVDSSIKKHYHGQVLDIIWMALSLQCCIGISLPVVEEDVGPWCKSQIQPFHKHSISVPMAASARRYSDMYRECPKHPAANYLCHRSQACKYIPGCSRNTKRGDDQQRDCVNQHECAPNLYS